MLSQEIPTTNWRVERRGEASHEVVRRTGRNPGHDDPVVLKKNVVFGVQQAGERAEVGATPGGGTLHERGRTDRRRGADRSDSRKSSSVRSGPGMSGARWTGRSGAHIARS